MCFINFTNFGTMFQSQNFGVNGKRVYRWIFWKYFIFYILSFINYYTIITENSINLGNGKLLTLIVVLFISITNYFIFNHKNQWEDIIAEFDELPRRKNKNWELASIRNCFIDNF